MIRVFRLNCGSSGIEDLALTEAVRLHRELIWAETPEEADVFVLTGPVTQALRAPLLTIWHEQIAGRAPLVAVGRTSIDGQPFGRGGLADLPDIVPTVKVDGAPPAPTAIQNALKQAVRSWERRHSKQ